MADDSPVTTQEDRRLAALERYRVMDTPREGGFDDLAALAAEICGTPIAVVNLIGDGRQWFKAEVGLGVDETPLETSFCGTAILEEDFLLVPDATLDERFACNPLVTAEPGLRFYAGALLKTSEGLAIGTLCVLDYEPRSLNPFQEQALRRLARQVMAQLELRRAIFAMEDAAVERERAAELRRYRDIVEANTSPICAFDTAHRLIAFNKAHNDEFRRVNGFDTKVGDVFPDLFIPEQRPVMRALMDRALSGESFTVHEEFGRPELGKPCWEIHYTPLRDETGRVVGAFHLANDVTARLIAEAELAEAQEALRQSQKLEAIGQLTGGVAHDFNNLLTVIRGSVDLLRRDDLSAAKRARYVDAIGDTADRAARLTGQLLAFARRQSLSADLFDAGASLGEVATILETMTGSRIELDLQVPNEPFFIVADRSQFDTAIVNMGINARDAMNGQGRLSITTGPVSGIPPIRGHAAIVGDFIAVTISDTGAGIPKDQLDRIFEPFFTTKGVGQGTGLGLSQVIGFAKQSGGDIRVDSTPGQGSTFTLYLPRAYPDGAAIADGAEGQERIDGEGLRVLVVEDNQQVGRFATAALGELGYESELATDAVRALEMLKADHGRFHVVFSDVVMPGMDGIELGQKIRGLHPDLPVILTSGYSHVLAQNGRHGFELLHKPYSVEQLARVLRKAVVWSQGQYPTS
jgi:PAS domain S-box-containing protein